MTETPDTLDLYFDGVLKTCTKKDDPKAQLKEHLYVAEDDSFVKFPDEYAEDDSFEAAVERYNKANDNVPEIIPDVVYGEVITHDSEGNPVK
jgi:hypothetical protein